MADREDHVREKTSWAKAQKEGLEVNTGGIEKNLIWGTIPLRIQIHYRGGGVKDSRAGTRERRDPPSNPCGERKDSNLAGLEADTSKQATMLQPAFLSRRGGELKLSCKKLTKGGKKWNGLGRLLGRKAS